MRTKPAITASDADTIIAACKAEAVKNNWKVSIAVVDDGGHLVQFHRMDGANILSVRNSAAKVNTAAITRHPTKFWEDMLEKRPGFLKFENHLPVQGGVLITSEGECVGAVGVAGRQPQEDEQIAIAGVAALG